MQAILQSPICIGSHSGHGCVRRNKVAVQEIKGSRKSIGECHDDRCIAPATSGDLCRTNTQRLTTLLGARDYILSIEIAFTRTTSTIVSTSRYGTIRTDCRHKVFG